MAGAEEHFDSCERQIRDSPYLEDWEKEEQLRELNATRNEYHQNGKMRELREEFEREHGL